MTTHPDQLYGKPWNEGEYLAVLHAYMSHRSDLPSRDLPWIKTLAKLLGRTEAAVVLRLLNFMSLDPQQPPERHGLDHGGPICERIFLKWFNESPDTIAKIAGVVGNMIQPEPQMSLFSPLPVRMPAAFQKYGLMDWLGEGGFADVYCAVDSSGDRVAIKMLKAAAVRKCEEFGRFRREIAAMKMVDHPNVLKLHEDNLGDESDHPAFVMDIAACSLHEYIERRAEETGSKRWPVLPPGEAAEIMRAVAAGALALHHHRSRIIHRDIKPTNVLRMPDGRWVLADFGLCKFLGPVNTSVAFSVPSNRGWGTEIYAAPEQWHDFEHSDERTDVYALGVLLWELFTCQGPPFPHDASYLGLTPELACLFNLTHARDPKDRLASVEKFVDQFDAAIEADSLTVCEGE